METVKAVFSTNLRALLKRDAMLPNHLAMRLGVGASVVKRWIDGVSLPEASAIDLLRKSCGWSLSEMFGESGGLAPPVKLSLDDAIRVVNQSREQLSFRITRKS